MAISPSGNGFGGQFFPAGQGTGAQVPGGYGVPFTHHGYEAEDRFGVAGRETGACPRPHGDPLPSLAALLCSLRWSANSVGLLAAVPACAALLREGNFPCPRGYPQILPAMWGFVETR
ncbi:hypothetical protein PIB30_030645 [Stylosanthes scabra]|uniref:Uncharacterized protein n=1 Tax=Stylosanthes scabra TaxID=79078 RepID=A0ABU6Y8Z2_9FABA|nr:hypothetical protein [Stylosanthes scabra]